MCLFCVVCLTSFVLTFHRGCSEYVWSLHAVICSFSWVGGPRVSPCPGNGWIWIYSVLDAKTVSHCWSWWSGHLQSQFTWWSSWLDELHWISSSFSSWWAWSHLISCFLISQCLFSRYFDQQFITERSLMFPSCVFTSYWSHSAWKIFSSASSWIYETVGSKWCWG